MSKPHKCPVCNGDGKRWPSGVAPPPNAHPPICHACKGKGVLWGPGPNFDGPLKDCIGEWWGTPPGLEGGTPLPRPPTTTLPRFVNTFGPIN